MQMRALDRVSEDQLAELLPQPLLDNYRLSQGYTRLVDLARNVPADPAEVLEGVIRQEKAPPRRALHPLVNKALTLLAGALEHPDQEEPELCRHFEVLLELFQTLPTRDRKRLLSILRKFSDTYQSQP
jgi:hypothetical protein